MSNLYLVYSPYHMLLCFAIAASQKKAHNVLFVAGSYFSMANTYETFRQIFPNVQFQVEIINKPNQHGNFFRFLHNKLLFKRLKLLIDELGVVDNFYYSCEWNVRTTYLSHVLKLAGNNTKFNFLEDGIATYVEDKLKTKRLCEKISDRIVYGSWHKSCPVQGGLNEGACIQAIRPDLLPGIYADRECLKICCDNLLQEADLHHLPQDIQKMADSQKISVLIALDSIDSSTSGSYLDLIRDLISSMVSKGETVAVKRHPADLDNKKLAEKIPFSGNVIELPAHLPVEVYYFAFEKSLKMIIGSLGTSIFSAKWLLPQTEVLSIYSEALMKKNPDAENYIRVFTGAGIKIQLL